jgi:hypothetical protein
VKDKSRDPRAPNLIGKAWFEAADERIPQALYSYALGMELYTYGRRVKNATMYRLVTGEDPPITLGMWMSRKAASSASGYGGNYTKPYSNIISNGCSVLENRIGTVQPFVTVQPNDVSFEVRSACQDATAVLDSVFDQNRFGDLCRVGFRDKFTWGMRFCKVEANEDDGAECPVKIGRVLPDEIIVDEVACATGLPPSNLVQRVYISRSDAWAAYGGKDSKIDAAIRGAPQAFMNQYLTATYNDFICVLEGWSLPSGGKDGKNVLCLQNVHLRPPKPWKRRRFPFAVERWAPQMLGYFSPGGAYQMSPYQMQVNNLTEQINACIRAVAYPRWLTMKGSTVTAVKLGGRPGAVHEWTGGKPEAIVPTAVNGELYEERDRWENKGYASVGLTQQQVQGQKQPGVNAGVALRMIVNIEDSRNKSLLLDAEQFSADVGDLAMDVLEDTNATVRTGEYRARDISWKEIAQARKSGKVKAFPISSLPATPEGKQQQIEDWYAAGKIDVRAAFRLQALPDLTSYQKLVTASDDLLEDTLDRICREQKFLPPEPTYENPPAALKHAWARYNLEKRYQSPRKVLRCLQQFIAVLADQINNPNGQTLSVPQQAPGLDPAAVAPSLVPPGSPGAAPAPPPLPFAPGSAPPVQLAA